MDVLDLFFVALLLGSGIGFLVYGVRLLWRGDAVTAEEAVKWRHSTRKEGFDASPDMTPDVTDILVRAWRSANSWPALGSAVGALMGGALAGVSLIVGLRAGSADSSQDQPVLVIFVGSLLAMSVFGLIGVVVSLLRIKRGPRNEVPPVILAHLRGRRKLYTTVYMVVVVGGDLILMTLLILRLASGLDCRALARAFALPGMWLAPVAPIILLSAAIIMEIVARWAIALPSLDLPQDQTVRQHADSFLRVWAVRRIYSHFQSVTLAVVMAQFILLGTTTYLPDPLFEFIPSPLERADLSIWFGVFFIVSMIGGIPISTSVVPTMRGVVPMPRQPDNGQLGHIQGAE
jgi:hypothetical protein